MGHIVTGRVSNICVRVVQRESLLGGMMMKRVLDFLRKEDGTETVEWAIIIGIIAVGAIALVASIGAWVLAKFEALDSAIQAS